MKMFVRLWQYLAQLFVERKIFQTNVVENIKTYFMFHNFFFESRTLYEIMWKNMVEPDHIWQYVPVIWYTRFTYWITNGTDTHSECVILIALPCEPWFRKRSLILRSYEHCLSRCCLFLITCVILSACLQMCWLQTCTYIFLREVSQVTQVSSKYIGRKCNHFLPAW